MCKRSIVFCSMNNKICARNHNELGEPFESILHALFIPNYISIFINNCFGMKFVHTIFILNELINGL